VITCVVEYVIDPAQIDVFERFARRWRGAPAAGTPLTVLG
jgi:hypothetical protein